MLVSVFAFFLLLALVSFHPGDPGWTQAGLQPDVHNWVGSSGALLADLLLFSFGWVAYVLPFCCAFLGWFLFQHLRHLPQLDYLTIGLRIIGGVFLALGATGISSMNFDPIFTFSAGGFVGDVISTALVPYFSTAGTVLILMCFFATGFTLLTGISWLYIIDSIGAATIWTAHQSVAAPAKLLSGNISIPLPQLKGNKDTAESNDTIEITSLRAEPPAENSTQKERRVEPEITIPDEIFADESVSDDLLDDDIEQYWSAQHKGPQASSHPSATSDDNHGDDGSRVDTSASEPTISTPKSANKPKQTYSVSELSERVNQQREQEAPVGDMPSFDLLERADRKTNPITPEELEVVSRLLESKLADFSVEARVVGVYPGPVITRFELDLAPGVKASKVTGLARDLARAMSAISVRVVEVIPGKSLIGLELPNKKREMVRLSEVITCDEFQQKASALTMVLGADIGGKPVIVDLAKMPHLLVAGTTGSGKSVGVNVMILSLLYKSTPEDVRLIMIDPKVLELSVYRDIPHLLADVVTDMKKATNALRWCVGEMERRYQLLSAVGVRNLSGYNAKITAAIEAGEPIKDPLWRSEESMLEEAPDLEKLPSIVVVVDEFADMMMSVGKKAEELIARIAQKARAAGIHLILATQRPSVDVITGLIKANIPTRIAFQVSGKIDSRTILDQQGAESLLGMGDMLYQPAGAASPTRVHGAFVDDHEVHAVVNDWKKRGKPEYIDEILDGEATADILLPGEQSDNEDQDYDAFYDEAVAFVTESRRASVSSVQRKFRIGYNRAARLVEQMEMNGVVSSPAHNGNREVLAPAPPRD